MDMSIITQGPGRFDNSLDSMLDMYKQEQQNLKQCRERIVQFVDELNQKDANIREYKSSIQTSTRYINRLETVNVGLQDNLIEERAKTKSLEDENRELKIELEKLKKEAREK